MSEFEFVVVLLIGRHVRLHEEVLVQLLVLELALLLEHVHKSHATHLQADVVFHDICEY